MNDKERAEAGRRILDEMRRRERGRELRKDLQKAIASGDRRMADLLTAYWLRQSRKK